MARFDVMRVLITGGTSGIGLATARRIADDGGGTDVLFLNAGDRATADQGGPDAFGRIHDVNVRGPVLQMQALDPM